MESLLFAFAAVFSDALRTVLLRFTLRDGCDERPLLIWYQFAAAIILFVFLPLPGLREVSALHIALTLLSGALWAVFSLYNLKSHVYLDATTGAIYSTLSFILVAGAGVILFSEQISIIGMSGMVMILFGVISSGGPLRIKAHKGLYYKAIAIATMTVNLVLCKYLSAYVPASFIGIVGFAVPGMGFMFLYFEQTKSIPRYLSMSKGLWLLFPILSAATYHCTLKAFALGELSTTYSILQTSVVFVFVLGVLVLGETRHIARRSAASFACILGAFLICNF